MFIPWRLYIIILVPLVWVIWLWLGKRRVRTNGTAILATAIPPTILIIIGLILQLLDIPYSQVTETCLIVSLSLAGAAMLSSIVFAIMRKWEIAKGTGFGGGIGFAVGVIAVILMIVFRYG